MFITNSKVLCISKLNKSTVFFKAIGQNFSEQFNAAARQPGNDPAFATKRPPEVNTW